MLRFCTFANGRQATGFDLSGAYLFGSDGVPLRAEIGWEEGYIVCNKRAAGPAGLAIVWPVAGAGSLVAETPRLLERKEPYVLPLELARGQLMRLQHKREEWGLFDVPDMPDLAANVAQATELLISALKSDNANEACSHGEQALAVGLKTAEALTRYHATFLLERRKQTAGFSRRVFGCQVDLSAPVSSCGKLVVEGFDFASLPMHWKSIEPTERNYQWKPLDTWVEWLAKQRIPIKASHLVSLDEAGVPEWLRIWEHDFETVRDLVTEHIRRVVNRYGSFIQVWDVVSGIHAGGRLSFNFEQLMELTRLAVTITRQLAPRSTTIIDVVAPWGEYYACNQRTIPPMLYVDMAIQSGVHFDAIGLQFVFGARKDGLYVRDMFQISSLIDRFAAFGRPIHITAVTVPSGTDTAPHADSGDAQEGGMWHEAWSEGLQAQWVRDFCEVALARPSVETITWRDLTDGSAQGLPHGGLVRTDLTPKRSYEEFLALRKEIVPSVSAE